MCETTRAIERHPETQRLIVRVLRACDRIRRDVAEIIRAREEADAVAERDA